MQNIIASTYTIEKEIGAGGGGIVYLATHLRLGKKVVLKADKRTVLSVKPEVLRQEVDILKQLSHTYIPQVYDFFVENDTVYTVMDYIEGESFDKPLKRGEHFSQVQVIDWACQLLEALCYLHSRPPHGILHGDIKPANIMLTPENEICLIDFNIALALGEAGAVKVGYSQGYASPEHYGQEQTPIIDKRVFTTELLEIESTELLMEDNNRTETLPQKKAGSNISSSKGQLLDIRSDIYSLGATLYHILTGVRPAANAKDVIPISEKDYSSAVVAIIMKAMAVDPIKRYQSAEEMLYDFTHLYEADSRTKKYKRTVKATAVILTTTFLLGGMASWIGLKQMEQRQNAYVLAEYAENALQEGDVSQALSYAVQALPTEGNIFSPPYTAQAQKALTDALGVYDLSDGFKLQGVLELPSEPLKIAIAPNGYRAAVFYAYEVLIFDTTTEKTLAVLEAEPSALSDLVFVDNDTLLYAGTDGISAYSISQGKILWSGEKTTTIALSADSQTVAAVYKDSDSAVVYDAMTGAIKRKVNFSGKKQSITVNDGFADPEINLFALNGEGTWLAVSFSNGGLMLYCLDGSMEDIEIYDQSIFSTFTGGFYKQYFAFSATENNQSVFAVLNMKESVQTGGFSGKTPFYVQADESGIYIANENIVVEINPETGAQRELAYTDADILQFYKKDNITLVATDNNAYQFFDNSAKLLDYYTDKAGCNFIKLAEKTAIVGSSNAAKLKLLALKNYSDSNIFTYDTAYLHDEARISADKLTLMLYRYDRFRLYRMEDGKILADVLISNADQVYDQQYIRENGQSSLKVFYNDGMVKTYSATDGTLISTKQEKVPDSSLTEEFLTEQYHIVAPLHETPIVYDRESGQQICTLEPDDYLTYVTQVDDYIITEYITTTGERYGILLNEQLEPLAELPNLCDILGEELIFDYQTGNLRKSSIYSLQELLTLVND